MINKNFTINENKTILDAIKELNLIEDVSRLILFVCSNKGKVIGSLTDGDIRRSLVEYNNLNKRLGDVCYKEFTYRRDNDSFIDLNSIRKLEIKMLPLLNKNNQLIKVIDLDKVKSILPLECMIMAGGRGKRLSPATDNVPKPMLLLGDKPIIEHNIDRETEDFELTVSSAGMDQPFKILRQYQRYLGREVQLTTKEGERHKGKLLSADEKEVVLEVTTKEKIEGKKKKQTINREVIVPMEQVKETRVVISFK